MFLQEAKDPSISVSKGTFSWNDDNETPSLHDVNLEVKEGELLAIVAPVGVGKVSIITLEMKVAYVCSVFLDVCSVGRNQENNWRCCY